jgi:hypothetical protein
MNDIQDQLLSLLDINNDGVVDLLLGDVDFLNIKALINGGSNVNANMTSVTDSFPISYPINLPVFPCPFKLLDIYNDGQLIICWFLLLIQGLVRSAGYKQRHGCTIYRSVRQYHLIDKAFLQDETIDVGLGAYPVFADLTNDSLTDLLVSNYGMLDTVVTII